MQIKKATAVKQVIELCRRGFNVFINMCDGAWDEDRAGIEVIDVLLRFNQAFTGANKEFFDPARETQKNVANYYGVRTPGFCFGYDMDSVLQATKHLKFPVICKHFNSYNSLGMTKKSKCSTEEELLAEAQRFIENYGGKVIYIIPILAINTVYSLSGGVINPLLPIFNFSSTSPIQSATYTYENCATAC